MNISIRKPTQPATNDQKLLLNFLISLLASACITGLETIYQSSTANGVTNIGTLILTGVTVFGVSFGHGLYAYVPAHITEEIQALRDTVNDFQQPATVLPTSVPATSVVIHAASVTVPATPAPINIETVESMPEVTPVQESVSTVPGDVVSGEPLTPGGVTTPEEASQKTQKIAVVKPNQATTPLVQG